MGNAMRTYAHALTKERELALEPAMSLDALVALPDRPRLVADGPWWNRMECPLTDGGRTVVTCERANDPGADALMLGPNKPHTVGTLLLAHALDPQIRLCEVAQKALDDPNLLAGWDDYFVSGVGWTKGTSQMVQSMAFAIGLAETCHDPPRR